MKSWDLCEFEMCWETFSKTDVSKCKVNVFHLPIKNISVCKFSYFEKLMGASVQWNLRYFVHKFFFQTYKTYK